MTLTLEDLFRQRLQDTGLLPYLFAERSQFLDFPDSHFVELVVRDGTKLPEFRGLVEHIKAESSQRLDAIVRAVWEVKSIGDPVQAYSTQTGAPRAAVQYPVDLEAGDASRRVWVEVTYLASETFDQHSASEDDVKRIVGEYVSAQLKKGGASYWDPERFPHLEINGDTADFIVSGALPGWKKRSAN